MQRFSFDYIFDLWFLIFSRFFLPRSHSSCCSYFAQTDNSRNQPSLIEQQRQQEIISSPRRSYQDLPSLSSPFPGLIGISDCTSFCSHGSLDKGARCSFFKLLQSLINLNRSIILRRAGCHASHRGSSISLSLRRQIWVVWHPFRHKLSHVLSARCRWAAPRCMIARFSGSMNLFVEQDPFHEQRTDIPLTCIKQIFACLSIHRENSHVRV